MVTFVCQEADKKPPAKGGEAGGEGGVLEREADLGEANI